jgi:hypothetical protein
MAGWGGMFVQGVLVESILPDRVGAEWDLHDLVPPWEPSTDISLPF